MSFGRVASISALALVACLVGCRIYRDQPGTGEERGASEPPPRTPAGATEPLDDREAVAAQRPAADALNLWVLNRPQGELVRHGVDGSDRAAAERAAQRPNPTVLVVLGVGEASACSQWYGRRAVNALAAGVAPLHVVASVLDSGHRWRWADEDGTVSAMVRSSGRVFGGVRAASPSSFSARTLEVAVERHVLMDGRNSRSPARHPVGPVPSIPPCEAAPAPVLGGPLGILIRTESGEFFGGVISIDLPADAGVVSVMTEYGVALSVGPRGGVLMVSDCPVLPPDRVAERVYASTNWASSTAALNEPGPCGTGHALLTAERAWVTTGSPLSWAEAELEAAPPPAVPPALEGDAGAGVPGPVVAP